MARKLRLEYPGAIYHVINRGNYRNWIFESEGARRAFEDCLFEVCARSGWVLHAYVIMGNHYHLAVETPEGNLVSGMHWFQATYANRFNQFRGERGHLFQGRYKSILVEEGTALGMLCNYIHLNPVRAGVTTVEQLGDYRYSSYWYLKRAKERPKFLDLETALSEAGAEDTKQGWKVYERYLNWQAEEGPLGKNAAYVSLSQGWALGSGAFKKALLKDHDLAVDGRAWEGGSVKEVRALHWERALDHVVKQVRDRTAAGKSAAWKIAVARHLKASTDAPNQWLAEKLDMGSHFYVSKHVGLMKKNPHHPAHLVAKRLRPYKKVNSQT